MNGESYRLATSKKAQRRSAQGPPKPENAKRRRPRHQNINRHGSTKINRASQPFSRNPIGTLSRRPLAHFVSAIDNATFSETVLPLKGYATGVTKEQPISFTVPSDDLETAGNAVDDTVTFTYRPEQA